jgi:hypothetical protein
MRSCGILLRATACPVSHGGQCLFYDTFVLQDSKVIGKCHSITKTSHILKKILSIIGIARLVEYAAETPNDSGERTMGDVTSGSDWVRVGRLVGELHPTPVNRLSTLGRSMILFCLAWEIDYTHVNDQNTKLKMITSCIPCTI